MKQTCNSRTGKRAVDLSRSVDKNWEKGRGAIGGLEREIKQIYKAQQKQKSQCEYP